MPQPDTLDERRWTGLWRRLGAGGDGLSIYGRLAAAYSEPARAYHTTEHLRDCLTQLDLAQSSAQRPDEVETALWFHDAVYLPGQGDNEDRSAELARGAMMEAGISADVTGRVANLVLSTRHAIVPHEPDARLTCDIDLSILGREPDVFDEFERRIRQEYAWVPEPLYRTARAEILEGFLRRDSIYQTKLFRAQYEAMARANLARVLGGIRG